ncbi:Dabb family protein [Mucilaginibacter sp. RS28]|uniref:Dabb family protein n=1 Tax=Mucilaginibacter straminoryzae TaxID=2932774 RepID=A0A9X1X877_9SPHI|nr:Dabb family protein [Mucilaginibacter straminoryzae]MCJ8211498.1 Dabb family protein [Mucilaginibacter straminoryzae]
MKTNRRNFIIAATAATASTTLPAMATTKNTYPIVHHVFFWLKNSSSTADRDKLVEGVKTLSKIETIRELQVGIVAATEKRDVVDQSWAVSELMFFDSLEAQKTYQDHPVHLEFIKNYSHLWEKVVVYDIQNV